MTYSLTRDPFAFQLPRNDLTHPDITCLLLGPSTRTQIINAFGLGSALTSGMRQCHGLHSWHPPASLADGPGYYPGNHHVRRLQWYVKVSHPGRSPYTRYPGFCRRDSGPEVR